MLKSCGAGTWEEWGENVNNKCKSKDSFQSLSVSSECDLMHRRLWTFSPSNDCKDLIRLKFELVKFQQIPLSKTKLYLINVFYNYYNITISYYSFAHFQRLKCGEAKLQDSG